MNILFSTLLMIITILFILLPFIRRGDTSSLAFSNGQPSDSINQKDLIFSTLGEIEFDYHMDKLSLEDYQVLKSNYAQIAVGVLKAENSNIYSKDDLNLPKYDLQDIEDEIEKELDALNRVELSTPSSTCFRCGAPLLKANQEFCHACGERQN